MAYADALNQELRELEQRLAAMNSGALATRQEKPGMAEVYATDASKIEVVAQIEALRNHIEMLEQE
jgi:hypothetical protein